MQFNKSQGIILHSLKFKDFDQILSVYTREEGLIKLFIKGAYSKNKSKNGPVDILTEIECIYAKRQSTLYTCREKSVLNHHLGLRTAFATLENACEMAKALLASQPEHKPAPLLYNLFSFYLQQLPAALNPATFAASFLLKILRLEGLLALTPYCCVCQADLVEHFLSGGESYCSLHTPPESIELSPFEAASLFTLAFSRSPHLIDNTLLAPSLKIKIQTLFAIQIHH